MTTELQYNELKPDQLIKNIDVFSEKVVDLLSILGIDLTTFTIDHIALRINSHSLAIEAHQAWNKLGTEISAANINGRPIIVIKLENTLCFGTWTIYCLELPYPAEGKSYPEQGWEHVEFVIPSKASTVEDYLTDLKKQFPQLAENWDQLANLGIKTKLSSPKGEAERLANPTVAFKRNGVCIKLHPHSLEAVIASEKL